MVNVFSDISVNGDFEVYLYVNQLTVSIVFESHYAVNFKFHRLEVAENFAKTINTNYSDVNNVIISDEEFKTYNILEDWKG